jgi:predicted transcriptional regulator
MLAKLTDADKLIGDLDDQIGAEKQALIRTIEQSNERMAGLLLRRARLKDALREVTGTVVREASPAQDDRKARTGVPGRASAIMVEALRVAGTEGLAGGEINRKILGSGLSVAAADKAKARLKHAKLVELTEDKRWRLTEKGKREATATKAR